MKLYRLASVLISVSVIGCAQPTMDDGAKASAAPTGGVRFTPYMPAPEPTQQAAMMGPPQFASAAPTQTDPTVGIEAAPPVTDTPRNDTPRVRTPAPEIIPPKPLDAVKVPDLIYSIEVHELLLPRDTISRNDEWWKRIDETSVDVATYDVLFKNGMRVGVAPMGELDALRSLVENRKSKTFSLTGAQGKAIELETNLGVEQQTLFWFDLTNHATGRVYDKSDNLLMLSFESTPRRPGWIRLSMMPTIRSTQKKLIYAVLPGRPDREFTQQVTETPFDVNLKIDMPVNKFMVLAPSPEAKLNWSLGRAFLTSESASEKLERVLIVVPRAFTREAVK